MIWCFSSSFSLFLRTLSWTDECVTFECVYPVGIRSFCSNQTCRKSKIVSWVRRKSCFVPYVKTNGSRKKRRRGERKREREKIYYMRICCQYTIFRNAFMMWLHSRKYARVCPPQFSLQYKRHWRRKFNLKFIQQMTYDDVLFCVT